MRIKFTLGAKETTQICLKLHREEGLIEAEDLPTGRMQISFKRNPSEKRVEEIVGILEESGATDIKIE